MSSPTDTNQASELFELCKEVYERTGWKYTIGKFHNDGSYDGYVGHRGIAYTPNPQNAEWLPKNIPLYTSDYLLEKLPSSLKDEYGDLYRLTVREIGDYWSAKYVYYNVGMWHRHGSTPLKALLRLTIALSEAGELK